MLAQTEGGWVAGATAVVALIGAVLGVLRYFNYRSKRDRIAAVGAVFETVVEALASDNEIRRLAAAIRLRRFFDPDSEVGAVGAAYARDALSVIAGVLREEHTGNTQKVLADGLRHAQRWLPGADLQRTNLQGAYLGETNLARVDLYRADLTGASLRRSNACGAVFYQARLIRTVLSGADLRHANFFRADLTNAGFTGARLTGANFTEALGIPPEITAHLDDQGRFTGPDEPLPAPPAPADAHPRLFVSRPSVATTSQKAVWQLVKDAVTQAGAEVVTIERGTYRSTGILADIRQAMNDCSGVIVLAFRQLEVTTGTWRPDTAEARPVGGNAWPTPWNQIEAGMAAALGLPVLALREPGVTGGILDLETDLATVVSELLSTDMTHDVTNLIQEWISEVHSRTHPSGAHPRHPQPDELTG